MIIVYMSAKTIVRKEIDWKEVGRSSGGRLPREIYRGRVRSPNRMIGNGVVKDNNDSRQEQEMVIERLEKETEIGEERYEAEVEVAQGDKEGKSRHVERMGRRKVVYAVARVARNCSGLGERGGNIKQHSQRAASGPPGVASTGLDIVLIFLCLNTHYSGGPSRGTIISIPVGFRSWQV